MGINSINLVSMFTAKSCTDISNVISRALVCIFLLISITVVHGVALAETQQSLEITSEAKQQTTVENLANIQKSIEAKQGLIRELRERLKKPEDASEKQELEQKIASIKADINGLQVSFEHLVLGGINRSILDDLPEQKINWQDELEQISRPLLSTLKELTAKPRQVDSLNRDIVRLQEQVKVIDKALESINTFKSQTLPPVAIGPINQLSIDWQQRKEDTQRKLEISQLKLDSLALTEGPADPPYYIVFHSDLKCQTGCAYVQQSPDKNLRSVPAQAQPDLRVDRRPITACCTSLQHDSLLVTRHFPFLKTKNSPKTNIPQPTSSSL